MLEVFAAMLQADRCYRRVICTTADATSAVLDSIGQALSENDRVTLTGFGTFSVRDRAARQMRAIAGNNAGQMIDVPARKYVALKAGNSLDQTVCASHQ